MVRGENHAPDDIELTVEAAHPSLRHGCGAVIQTAAQDGQRLVAIQEVPRDVGLEHAALFAAINRGVTGRHGLALDAIELIRAGSLPRTRNGKVSRHACLAALADGSLHRVARWQRLAEDAGAARPRAIEARMLAHLREMLPGTTVAAEDNLFELGIDLLGLHRLLARLNDSFGVEMPIDAVLEAPTVARLAAAVSRLRSGDLPAVLPESTSPPAGAASQAILEELRKLNSLVAEQTRLLAVLARAVPPAQPAAPDAPVDAPFALTETQREIMLLPQRP